ncbi:MAG: MFS transporter [Devosia sp.]|uniref:MFS transporter n=1 Tax=Devosia sp. TaxID=1871048 RepID=UPI003391AFD1
MVLRHRNFRLLWTGSLISNTGDWIDQLALNWLVLETTGSPAALGLVNLCRGLPILVFTLIGGAAADRFERRRLMLGTQTAAMIVALILAAMVYSGTASLWAIAAVATARGTIVAFNLPARHSLISEIVPRDDLARAIALNSMTINLTKVLGPLIAGLLIASVGLAACFFINALSFVGVLACLAAMHIPPQVRERSGSLGRNIVDGFAFIRDHTTIRILVLVALIPMFFGQPYITMLAVFAIDVFKIGPDGLGLLIASAATGSMLGALMVSTFADMARRGLTMLALLAGYGTLLICFSLNPVAPLAPFILLGVGAMQIAYGACNNTILQLVVPDHVRGRVLSVLFLNRSLVSFGTAFVATLSAVIGPQWSLAISGAIMVLAAALVFARSPSMRSLRA